MNVMQQLLMMNIDALLRDFAAYRTFHRSDSVINMRIPGEILERIKTIAASHGVPYQALISSVLFSLTGAGTDARAQPAHTPQQANPNAQNPSGYSAEGLAAASIYPAYPAYFPSMPTAPFDPNAQASASPTIRAGRVKSAMPTASFDSKAVANAEIEPDVFISPVKPKK